VTIREGVNQKVAHPTEQQKVSVATKAKDGRGKDFMEMASSTKNLYTE
jgi:hypothetical protein